MNIRFRFVEMIFYHRFIKLCNVFWTVTHLLQVTIGYLEDTPVSHQEL